MRNGLTMVVFTGDGSDKTICDRPNNIQGGDGATHADDTVGSRDGSSGATSDRIDAVACFTPGTVIATPDGERCVQDLRIGDLVHTRDNGIQPIVWAGQRSLTRADLGQAPDLCPVRIKAGALGPGLPVRDMLVSPNHRMLVHPDVAACHFDTAEVLVAASDLTARAGIDSLGTSGVTYVHFMCENHQIVLADGAWSESFQPGDETLRGVGDAQRAEIFRLFPALATDAGVAAYGAARRVLNQQEAALLV